MHITAEVPSRSDKWKGSKRKPRAGQVTTAQELAQWMACDLQELSRFKENLWCHATREEIHQDSDKKLQEWHLPKQKTQEEKHNEVEQSFSIDPTSAELEILRSPDLLEKIETEISKKVVIDGKKNRTLFILSCGRLVKNSTPVSYNLMVNAPSGTGKDFTLTRTLGIWPTGIEHFTRLTPTAFTYWKPKSGTWDGTILILTDVSEDLIKSDVFKVMLSDGSKSVVTKDQTAIEITINGKPLIFLTTANGQPNQESERRLPIIYLSPDDNLTRQIMLRKATDDQNVTSNDYSPQIRKALACLKRVKVRIPFAEVLAKSVFPQTLASRTYFPRFLDCIKAIASLYQFQRQIDGNGHIIAEPCDYDQAVEVFKEIVQLKTLKPLTTAQKRILQKALEFETEQKLKLKGQATLNIELNQVPSYAYKISDLAPLVGTTDKTVRDLINDHLLEFFNYQVFSDTNSRPAKHFWLKPEAKEMISGGFDLPKSSEIGLSGTPPQSPFPPHPPVIDDKPENGLFPQPPLSSPEGKGEERGGKGEIEKNQEIDDKTVGKGEKGKRGEGNTAKDFSLFNTIRDLDPGDGVPLDWILPYAKESGKTPESVDSELSTLRTKGDIFEVRRNTYKVVV